jgi:hypothetical protein
MSVKRPPIPTYDRKPAWRRACLAYREMRRAGRSDHEAHLAAVAAVRRFSATVERGERRSRECYRLRNALAFGVVLAERPTRCDASIAQRFEEVIDILLLPFWMRGFSVGQG